MTASDWNARHEEILAQMSWVRRLARGLVSDPGVAEDLAQNAWLIALQRPPRPGSGEPGLRAWFATVTRRLAKDWLRSEGSRHARERTVARNEADASASEVVERGALQTRVSEAVMGLDEPYRSTILFRYLDELSIPEIAERMAASPAAIRKRLWRGLAKLRATLDEEYEGGRSAWTHALVLLVLPKAESTPEAAGASLPSVTAPAALVLFFAAVISIAWWGFGRTGDPRNIPTRGVPSTAPSDVELAKADPDGLDVRVAFPEGAHADPAPEPPPPARIRLWGIVIDPRNQPVPGVALRYHRTLEDGSSVEGAGALSDFEGRFELDVLPGRGQVRVEGERHSQVLGALVYELGQESELCVVAAPRRSLFGSITGRDGHPLPNATVNFRYGHDFRADIPRALGHTELDNRSAVSDDAGRFQFEDVPGVPGCQVRVVRPGYFSKRVMIPEDPNSELNIELEPADHDPRVLWGVVVDPEGRPVEGARVGGGPAAAMLTGPDGSFQADVREFAHQGVMWAVAEGYLPGSAAFDLGPRRRGEGPFPPLRIELGGPTARIQGRLFDAEGEPAGCGMVWIEGGTTFGRTYVRSEGHAYLTPVTAERIMGGRLLAPVIRCDADGRFVIDGLLPDRRYTVVGTSGCRFGRAELVDVAPGHMERELRIPPGGTATRIRGQVLDLDGNPIPGVRVSPGLHPRSAGGSVVQQPLLFGESTVSDSEGRFDLGELIPDELVLNFWAGAHRVGANLTLGERPDGQALDALSIELPLRTYFRWGELPEGLDVKTFEIRDREDRPLLLQLGVGGHTTHRRRAALDSDALLETWSVSERAHELVLFDSSGEVVHRETVDLHTERVLRLPAR